MAGRLPGLSAVTASRSGAVFWTSSRISDSCVASPTISIQDSSFNISTGSCLLNFGWFAIRTRNLLTITVPLAIAIDSISFKPGIAQGPIPHYYPVSLEARRKRGGAVVGSIKALGGCVASEVSWALHVAGNVDLVALANNVQAFGLLIGL